MDYRALLKKYIDHIGACEGIDFLREGDQSDVEFTDEEWAELRKLAAELQQER